MTNYLGLIRKITVLLSILSFSHYANAQVGFATCANSEGAKYDLKGGQGGRQITLLSNGSDMSDAILHAIQTHDIIILDGNGGDFVVGRTIVLKNLKNKTIRGINNAQIRTKFRLRDDIRALLDSAGTRTLSTRSGGGILSNGNKVREQRELHTRQLLIDYLNDHNETFRSSGGIQLSYCENIILKNIRFQGPGAVDVSGNDLVGLDHSNHIWIDSCHLRDGMDGNMDIIAQSDFITISHCTFGYTYISYDHMNSNLIGASDRVLADRGHFHITFSHCQWLAGCRQRMPMVRYGTIHLYNCLWQCQTKFPVIDARLETTILIEQCTFKNGVSTPFRSCETALYEWRDCNFTIPYIPTSNAKLTIPYLIH